MSAVIYIQAVKTSHRLLRHVNRFNKMVELVRIKRNRFQPVLFVLVELTRVNFQVRDIQNTFIATFQARLFIQGLWFSRRMTEAKIVITENVAHELGNLIKTEIESFFGSSPESDFVIGLSGKYKFSTRSLKLLTSASNVKRRLIWNVLTRRIFAQLLRRSRQGSLGRLDQSQVHLLRRTNGPRWRPGVHLWHLQGQGHRKGKILLDVSLE